MTSSAPTTTHDESGSVNSTGGPSQYLTPDRVVAGLSIASRKKLFEEFAVMIARERNGSSSEEKELERERIFETLHTRERLGCTAVGNGIALPHGRIENFEEPVICVARLESAIDYDAPDGDPVWLAVCLLVPTDANEMHLNILASLASRFSDEKFVDEVRDARDGAELYSLFSSI
jgi:PTS system nitrogen regulatory IIA component